jgi:cysteine desulfurase
MEVYFDNSATTQVIPRVCEAVTNAMTVDYGNPSSLHKKGYDGEKLVREARETIAKALRVSDKEIIFTSGGTESDNLAILGTALANRRTGKHLITTVIEHPAVLSTMAFLEKEGFRVTYLPVDENGIVREEDLQNALCPDTILVSIMYVNNEIGAVEPISALSKVVKAYNPAIVFHTDAVQAFGKYPIRPVREGIDLMSVSAHKLHGPKGVGFLYIKDKTKIRPILFGGGQQRDMRPSTENVPGIAGLAEAVRDCYEDMEEKKSRMYQLKDHFVSGIQALEGTHIHGKTGTDSAPHVVSVGFEGIRSEVLLHSLEDRGIYVSSGSACASNHPATSGTLKAIGAEARWLDSTIRFSFSDLNTIEEADYCLQVLEELLPVLRKYRRT